MSFLAFLMGDGRVLTPNQTAHSEDQQASSNTAHLQHSDLLTVAKQAEGKRVFVIQTGADLAASKGQRSDVALQVVAVLVEEQLVVLQAAPALSPAVIGQNVQVACRRRQIQRKTERTELTSSPVFMTSAV